jgi:SAM-dependent methyltransferase
VEPNWALELFNKSVLKQRKFAEISALVGTTVDLRCLDIGSDNGVISYLFRRQGGSWASVDLNEQTVQSIRALVETDVHQIDGRTLPFADGTFDLAVIVDFLEHIPDDGGFVRELRRVIKPGGVLVANVPHEKHTLLRRLRFLIGQTDEKHGHLRPGYTVESIRALFGDCFTVNHAHTYSKFFSEFIDMVIVFAVTTLKGGGHTQKGLIVTGDDLQSNRKMFRLYSLIYPIVRVFSMLDSLLPFRSGYMLVVKATANTQQPIGGVQQ